MVRLAVHVHSDWSYDGRWSLSRISTEFGRRGFDAVLLCEHCRTFDRDRWTRYQAACRESEAETGAALVPGIEYSDPENTVHIPVWGAREFLGSEIPTGELMSRLAGQAQAFAMLAHPNRRAAWRRIESRWIDQLHAVEIWNRKSDGVRASRVRSWIEETGLPPMASLDFHSDRQRFPMVTTIAGIDSADVAGMLPALREGRYRTTVGGVPLAIASSRISSGLLGLADGVRRAVFSRAPHR